MWSHWGDMFINYICSRPNTHITYTFALRMFWISECFFIFITICWIRSLMVSIVVVRFTNHLTHLETINIYQQMAQIVSPSLLRYWCIPPVYEVQSTQLCWSRCMIYICLFVYVYGVVLFHKAAISVKPVFNYFK